jgi:hypothetical protein
MTIQILLSLCLVLFLWALAWRLQSVIIRQAILLGVSYLFYANWGIGFLLVLVASSLMNYQLGLWLRRQPTVGRLWVGVTLNVLLLSCFKYLPPPDCSDAGVFVAAGFCPRYRYAGGHFVLDLSGIKFFVRHLP